MNDIVIGFVVGAVAVIGGILLGWILEGSDDGK